MQLTYPLKAVADRCYDCSGFSYDRRRDCPFTDCSLHPFRLGKKEEGAGSVLKAIRKHCLWCCLDQPNVVKLCPADECPVWPYRFGKNPKRKGAGPKDPNKWIKKGDKNRGTEGAETPT